MLPTRDEVRTKHAKLSTHTDSLVEQLKALCMLLVGRASTSTATKMVRVPATSRLSTTLYVM